MGKFTFFLLLVYLGHCALADVVRNLVSDLSVKTGQLPNGLTYYIRQNKNPEGRACFYLVQNVGALLENDQQNGLAHFLEHMAFNGSLHFPGKSMVGMLERHGLGYGKEIDAYTALNETIYGLNHVPVENGLVDSCLLVMYDWACGLTLDSVAMEAERPVILEEWRTRRDANFRLQEQIRPGMYRGSRYADRDIIGDTAIIWNIRPNEFRQFYHTWYRPDLQAVIVVGDFDPDEMEMKIKTRFSAIPEVKNVPERPFFEIPEQKGLTFLQATDQETVTARIEVRTLEKAGTMGTNTDKLKALLVTDVFNRLMRERIPEALRINKVQALGGGLLRYTEQRGYNSLLLIAGARPGKEEHALEALLTEKERVKRFGFTRTEMERVKSMILRETETACARYSRRPSTEWIEKLSQHFLEDVPLIESQDYLGFVRRELALISSEQLVATLRKWDVGHYIVSVTGPAGMTEMNAGMVDRIIQQVGQMELQPWQDSREDRTLFPAQLIAGKIVKEKAVSALGAEEWTLSNGARVIFRPVANENQVSLMAVTKGGLSLCAIQDVPGASVLPALVDNYGVGNLNEVQLQQALSGRNVVCGTVLKPWYAAIGGQAPADETETLLQLLWLRFEQPRFDSLAHVGVLSRLKKRLADRGKDPFSRISDSLTAVLGNYRPRLMPILPGQLDNISLDQIRRIYKQHFSGVSDYTFIITGNIDATTLKPWVEKYIASLPASKGRDRYVDFSSRRGDKEYTKEITLPLSAPRSTVIINYSGEMDYSFEHELYQMLLKEILEARCMEQLRTREGATYQVIAQSSFDINPAPKCGLMFNFDCAPGRGRELASRVYDLVGKLAKDGPAADELNKAVKKIQTTHEMACQTNAFWINTLLYWTLNGVNKADESYYCHWLERVKPADISRYINKVLAISDRTALIVNPL